MATRKLQVPRITPPAVTRAIVVDPAAARSLDGLDGVSVSDADLTDLRLGSVSWVESVLTSARMENTKLPGGRFLDVRLDGLDAIDLTAPGSTWRDSEILASRLGAGSLYDSAIDSLRVVGTKVGFLNLRGSAVNDLVLEDCAIEEIDLSDAVLTRATFSGCTIGTLTIRGTTLRHVDLRGAHLGTVEPVANLRGAVIDAGQLVEIAAVLADGLGIVVE